jgi:hypothetical protein
VSNWIDYKLDVLATSPIEINQIAERLKEPSADLTKWLAKKHQPVNEAAAGIRELLKFESVTNLGFINQGFNKARRFSLEFKDRYYGIVNSHMGEVSNAYPSAVFLLEYSDQQWSYSGRRVIRDGDVIQEVHDGNQQAQAIDWVLLDIFAPFKAEYELGLEFGSLGRQGLADLSGTVNELK